MRPRESRQNSNGVLEGLASYIRSSGLQVGQRLPAERELALQLGVSRPLVREALGRWAALGVVETINGRGTFLRAPVTLRAEYLVVSVNVERRTLLETLEVRRALETEAAALAAERATPEQIDRLDTLLVAVEQAYERVGDAPDEDWAFHQALYEASGNPLFLQLIQGLLTMFHRFWENPLNKPDFARRGIRYHRDLVEQVRARNPDGARAAVLQIINVLQEELEI